MALLLQKRGVARIRPLAGGLQAWLDRGFPTVVNGAAIGAPSLTP